MGGCLVKGGTEEGNQGDSVAIQNRLVNLCWGSPGSRGPAFMERERGLIRGTLGILILQRRDR